MLLPDTLLPASSGYHALLHADCRLVDPGHGFLLHLIITGGQTLRVRASPEVLRLGPFLQGHFRARLHLRTTIKGQLKPDLRLIDLSREGSPIAHASRTSWSATGLVSEREHVLLVAQPGMSPPIRLAFQLDRGVADTFQVGDSVHAVGVLRGNRLIATSLQPTAALYVPPHWRFIRIPINPLSSATSGSWSRL